LLSDALVASFEVAGGFCHHQLSGAIIKSRDLGEEPLRKLSVQGGDLLALAVNQHHSALGGSIRKDIILESISLIYGTHIFSITGVRFCLK